MHRKHELKKWKNSSKSVYLHFFVDAFKIHSLFSIYFSKLVPQKGKLFLLLHKVFSKTKIVIWTESTPFQIWLPCIAWPRRYNQHNRLFLHSFMHFCLQALQYKLWAKLKIPSDTIGVLQCIVCNFCFVKGGLKGTLA